MIIPSPHIGCYPCYSRFITALIFKFLNWSIKLNYFIIRLENLWEAIIFGVIQLEFKPLKAGLEFNVQSSYLHYFPPQKRHLNLFFDLKLLGFNFDCFYVFEYYNYLNGIPKFIYYLFNFYILRIGDF